MTTKFQKVKRFAKENGIDRKSARSILRAYDYDYDRASTVLHLSRVMGPVLDEVLEQINKVAETLSEVLDTFCENFRKNLTSDKEEDHDL